MSKYHFQTEIIKPKTVSAAIHNSLQNEALRTRKPRVLTVGMHLTKTRGGITTLIAEILNSSLKDDFEFAYIESQAEDFGKFGKAFLALQAIARFVWSCIWKRPELVYVHLGSNASLYRESIFILLAKLFGQTVVTHFHAGDIDNYYPFQSKIGQSFIRWAINCSDLVIAVSQESAKQLRNITDSLKISVIPNAIDTSVFNAGKQLTDKPSDGAVRLLFVGAVGKLKGERDLIKALAILRESGNTNIKVSFLGYGAESLKDYCEETGTIDFVEHLGAVSMSERIGFYQKADIFVLPTYAEAMPMSVIEAMAAGLAIISTPVGGIPELIEGGVDGFLFPPGDVNALAEKISYLLNNKDLTIKIGGRARKKASEQLNFPRYAGKLRQCLLAACKLKT
ncbi:MAG TPA: glycosyltransferase family 4 protein [Pyrinomonadaceae bacterium]|jgi:glycosyltransferase involved in cell wall biosynthesis